MFNFKEKWKLKTVWVCGFLPGDVEISSETSDEIIQWKKLQGNHCIGT